MATETRTLRTFNTGSCTIETTGFPHPASIRKSSFPEACAETDLEAVTLYTELEVLDTVGQLVYADGPLTVPALDGFYKLDTGQVAAIGGIDGHFDGFLTCP